MKYQTQRQRTFAFDGDTYDSRQDFDRLTTQLDRVRWLVTHPYGRWLTLQELAQLTGSSEAGVSARLRDLRKAKHGGLHVESQRQTQGTWKYRATYNPAPSRIRDSRLT